MIIQLTPAEWYALTEYQHGPFGEDSFESFMAEVCARLDADKREFDFDRDDYERIYAYRENGHQKEIDRIFKRALDKWHQEFFGEP